MITFREKIFVAWLPQGKREGLNKWEKSLVNDAMGKIDRGISADQAVSEMVDAYKLDFDNKKKKKRRDNSGIMSLKVTEYVKKNS